MSHNDENFFIEKNSELFLNTYLLTEIKGIKIRFPDRYNDWLNEVNDLYSIINTLYPHHSRLYNVLEYYLLNDIVDKIVIEINYGNYLDGSDKKKEIIVDKETKNHSLGDFLDIHKYIKDYEKDDNYGICIFLNSVKIEKIENEINEYLKLWEQNYFKSHSVNFYKKEKQIEIVLKSIKHYLTLYDNKDLLLPLFELVGFTHYDYISECSIDTLGTILYLEKKGILELKELRLGNSFYDMNFVIDVDEEKIKLNNFEIIENTKKNIINDFLIKIEKFKKLASKGILKINDEINLINELKSYNFGKLGEIITDEILFLSIEKLQTPPNGTQWTSRKRIDEPIYTNIISNNLLEWENLFKEIIQENGIISSNNNQEILLEDNIVKIYDDIIYYKDKYLFKNPKNLKEFPIKSHGNFDKMMDLLLKNIEGFVYFEDFKELEVYNKSDTRTPIKRITDTKDNLIKGVLKNLEIGNFTKIPNEYKFIIVKNKSLRIAL